MQPCRLVISALGGLWCLTHLYCVSAGLCSSLQILIRLQRVFLPCTLLIESPLLHLTKAEGLTKQFMPDLMFCLLQQLCSEMSAVLPAALWQWWKVSTGSKGRNL